MVGKSLKSLFGVLAIALVVLAVHFPLSAQEGGEADQGVSSDEASGISEYEAPAAEQGPAPSVEATEVEEGESYFHPGEDEPASYPDHPPFDQIPPMPMPEPGPESEASEPMDGGGQGILYNAVTGETVLTSAGEFPALEGVVQGGGYAVLW